MRSTLEITLQLDGQYAFALSTDSRTPGLRLSNFTGPNDSDEFATLAILASVAAGHYDVAEQLLPLFQNGSASAAYTSGLFGVEIDLRLFPALPVRQLSRRTMGRTEKASEQRRDCQQGWPGRSIHLPLYDVGGPRHH